MIGLTFALLLIACGGQQAAPVQVSPTSMPVSSTPVPTLPTPTPVPPTPTLVSPTATRVPPTATPVPPTLVPTSNASPTTGRIEGRLEKTPEKGVMYIVLGKITTLTEKESSFVTILDWVAEARAGESFSFDGLPPSQYIILNPPSAVLVAYIRGAEGKEVELAPEPSMGQADFLNYRDAIKDQLAFHLEDSAQGGYLKDRKGGKVLLFLIEAGSNIVIETPLSNYVYGAVR